MSHHNGGSGRANSQPDEVRQHIVSSVFNKRAPDGTPEETLIAYLKVIEDAGGGGGEGPKTRYLMLAVSNIGMVLMHKAKRNANMTFSKGKTWNLSDMRVLECIGPLDFALTMTMRRYHWSTERAKDQLAFLNSLCRVYKTYTKTEVPELINFEPTPSGGSSSRPVVSPDNQSSPLNIPSNLQPPPTNGRSGSFSSQNSGPGSYYGSQAEATPIPRRPGTSEDSRSQFGRSPLSEASFGRRPSVTDPPSAAWGASPNPSHSGIGMGPPPSQRKMSDGGRLNRPPSNGSTGMVKNPSNDGSRFRDDDRPSSSRSHRSTRSRGEAGDALSTPTQASTNRVISNSDIREPLATAPKPTALAPTITTTQPSPSVPSDPILPKIELKRQPTKPNRRASFHPPPLNTAFSREVLLTSRTGLLPGAGMTVDEDAIDMEEDSVLTNVEEMLEGFDWAVSKSGGGRKKGSADAIESRLLDELAALDSANIHAFLESDDRITQVLGHIDEALLELDDIDMQITGYRMQLNAVSDDISFIESQNRGLQVQTSNQQALLNEIRQLLQIVEVPPEDLRTLIQESPGTPKGIEALERAAASLYKALMAGRDSANAEVAATIARIQEYQQCSAQFSTRVLEYLDIAFKHQSESTLAEYKYNSKKIMSLVPHEKLGEYLMRYQGLVLYLKEMDANRYQRLCSNYATTTSKLHENEMKDLLGNLSNLVNTAMAQESNEASFASAAAFQSAKGSTITGAVQRSRTAIGFKPAPGETKRAVTNESSRKPAENYQKALMDIINQIATEESFVQAFLHITDTESTFAEYMELESYFQRQAARHAAGGMTQTLITFAKHLMEMMFGFVDLELKLWVEKAVERNSISIVGVIAVTERLAKDALEEDVSPFFSGLISKQQSRQQQLLDAFVNDQIRAIESAKVTVKKRKGVAFFIKHFPLFVEKMEIQLEGGDGSDDLPVRRQVDGIYERIIGSVFGCLQQLAKMDRADGQAAEDKGLLNYHIIMIENMHQFVEDVSKLEVPSLRVYLERAKGLYDENLSTYVKMMLRRSFARLMDFFDGVERLLQTTPISEISLHATYNRSALKKVLKDTGAKDMRKAVEAMSKRVEKHFTDDESVDHSAFAPLIAAVWKEVTAELKRETGRATELIKGGYSDSNLGLEFGVGDVENACKRMR